MKWEKLSNWRDCNYRACVWAHRYQLLGLVLMVLATILTILTLDSFGIAVMFIVGLLLLIHKQMQGRCGCCPCTKDEVCDVVDEDAGKVRTVKVAKKEKL